MSYDTKRTELATNITGTILSLASVVSSAGGDPVIFMERLSRMSAMELIGVLSSNKIGFLNKVEATQEV